MSTAADWYRRKLGPTTAPPAAPPRFVLGADGRAQPVYAQRPEEQAQVVAPWQQPVGPGEAPVGQTRTSEGLTLWRGSRAAQEGVGRCPECGSGNYMAEIIAANAPGTGGESGRRSAGHCMACGFSNTGRTDVTGPSIQEPTGFRGITQGEVPVLPARTAATPDALRFTGKFGVVARV